jgi:hypothetical protein
LSEPYDASSRLPAQLIAFTVALLAGLAASDISDLCNLGCAHQVTQTIPASRSDEQARAFAADLISKMTLSEKSAR